MRFKAICLLPVVIIILAGATYGGQLTSVAAIPRDNQAGVQTIYTVTFKTSTTGNGTNVGIPANGKIVITFPAGFGVTEVEIASSTTPSVLNGGLNASGSGNVVTVLRDSTGTPVPGDTTVGIRIGTIKNDTVAATNYSVTVQTQLKNGTIIDTGASATFSITHNVLATFKFDQISNQIAGIAFGIKVTAKDQYNNTVSAFNGVASLMDLTGSIIPDTTTNFLAGIWNGTVQINRSHSSNKITITAQNKAGTSNNFVVNPGSLHHFAIQNIASPQTAGAQFNITITAEDAYNNLITTFNNSATLSDNTGTISPTTTGAFSSGQWTGPVTITRKQKDVKILVSSSGVSSQSGFFNVQAGPIDHFVIANIAAQTAGIPFLIEVAAMDQYNNQVDQFNETVNINDDTGTITPKVSDNFSQGYWAGNVTVTQVRTNNMVRVQRTSNGTQSGTSNGFNVSHNTLDYFLFANIPTDQTAGAQFTISITAKDANGNTVTNFNGTASLSDLTNTISPTIAGPFLSGQWSGNVTITKSQTANRISAASGSKSGTSNNFNVNHFILDHFRIQTINSPRVAGQSFNITITAEDIYNNRVTSFTNTVNLNDATGTIFPLTSGNFGSGQWSGNVNIIKSANDVTITATRSTISGQSNPFNVEPAALDHFALATIGTKAAGVPFAISVTAQDFYNNRVTSFSGTVSIQDLTGTILPNISGPFDMGQWTGDVTITQVRTANRITVTNTAGSQTGSSNNFDVIAGTIDHFEIANIVGTKTAGVPFTIQITAKDANNATVTGFNGTVNLSDLSGTISPLVTPNFTNGIWSGSVTITKTYTNNKITASGAGKSGTSNEFTVQANSVARFAFEAITSPKTAGQGFSITIYARDSYENLVTTFTNSVNLSDNTNTITPVTTSNFSNGQWTGAVTITKSQNDNEITATQGSTTGKSNKFNIQAAALNRFTIDNLSTQQSNVPFTIKIIAKDQYNNNATQFSDKVTIADKTNTITPTVSDNFTNGQWSGNVTITQSYLNNVITVTRQGGTETGTSNSFDVTSSTIDHFVISAIGNQIAGQPFSIIIRAEDAANNLVTSFNGTASINDLTSSITPKTTGSFSGGQWTGNVTITKSRTANTITTSSSGKTGTSNTFNVDPASLDHFRISTINSPQVAGTPFSITVTAEDVYNNKATGFSGTANLIDNTGSLTPSISGAFSNGEWTSNVTITKSSTDNVIQVTGSGKTGQSNAFNVIPASLHHFVLGTISTQSAGLPFAINVTAQDNYGNTATQFTGKVNISDKSNTITPTVSGNFANGLWTGNVVISQAYASDVITVVRQGGSETGSSNSFDVISSALDHFVISTIGNQLAGQPFSITIRAEDSNNNLVTNFAGTASLNDLTNTISPTTTQSFSGGQWSGSVTITKSRTGNTITVTSGGKAGTSNSFNVNPASLDHFRISTIGSPQIAGQSFSITVTAEDVYDNKVTSFNSTVNLSESTNTILPTVSQNFSSGEWSGLVTITKTYTDNIITVSGSSKTGQSNKFNVNPASLQRFAIGTISTQAAGVPFAITVTAQDNYNNTATQFTGKVNISDKTNTISPAESGNFSSGRWTGNVVISQANNADVITVVRQGGTETGSSNSFDVSSSTIDHFVISTIGNQTAGQAFGITIRAEDKENNLVTSFNGTATLSDLTNTINPTTTPNFSGGQWSGNVTITKSRTGNTITVTSMGKAGTSNAFNISPASLDHFRFQTIPSPQVAGTSFTITIYAEDAYGNQVTSFNSAANLTDATNTISPATTPNFSSGIWSGNVTITKSQTDVTITASQSGKIGQSNIFNVNPGALTSFQISNISTNQPAGVPFTITVTALDAYSNIGTQFTGTVNIADLTNTIAPTISGNFVAGKWSGNVTITQVRQNNRITVVNTGGSQTGQSNLFNVIASSVDHFAIDNITSPKTAGVPFQIKITAQDKDNNTVTGFTGTASLSDLSGTISPITTTNFISGVWQGDVSITKSWTSNRITATSSGKAGQSNAFNVTHNVLDYFEFTNITSPRTAGVPFSITIKAKDIYGNIVTSYSAPVSLTDNTGTINPMTTTNFTSGEWTGNVRITRKQNDVYIVASGSGKIGQSNFFNVQAGNPAYLKIRDTAGGSGTEVGALDMTLDDKITLYAAGYDGYNNYVRDVISNWRATGTLDQPSPTIGQFTVFDPKTPGTTGKIHADSTGLQGDSTGTIAVGKIAYVKIRTASGGAGIELGNTTITADQTLAVYCAGYDAGKNYIGDISVQWRSIGTLTPAVNDTGKGINFLPTKAPASGKIIADHPTAIDDSTGTIIVVPGVPVGEILLTANPSVIPANGTSTSIITSQKIKDAKGNTIAKNTQFTVTTTLGTIITTDVNPLLQGIQIAADDSGKIQFTLRSVTAGGDAVIHVSAVNASATGKTKVYMSNLNILSVSSSLLAVSRGQANVPVSVVVENSGSNAVTNLSGGLIFKGPAPLFENRNADFPSIVRTDGVTEIPGGGNRTLMFSVSVSATAKTDTVTIDAWIAGQINTVTVNDTFAVSKHKLAVQMPPQLRITRVFSSSNEVSQGRTGIGVSMRVVNQGQANANVTLDTLSFRTKSTGKEVTGEYQIVPNLNNPTTILGGGSPHEFRFLISVSTGATLGEIIIDGRIAGKDANSGASVADNAADTTHTWLVKTAPIVGIKEFSPSQSSVTRNQTSPWRLNMVIENKGGSAVRFDSSSVSFLLGGRNVSSEYTIVKPTKFQKSGTNILAAGGIDTLRCLVTKTGSTLGLITIVGKLFLTDLASMNPINIEETRTDINVKEPGKLKIDNLLPSQDSVTRNQGQDWTIKLVLVNEGGSDIALNMQPANTFLNFSLGNDFIIKRPTSLSGGGLILSSGKVDTLTFIVDGTIMKTGNCIISAQVMGIQITSGDTTIATFQRTKPVIIEEPAAIKIISVENQATNKPFVNRGQVFALLVTLENSGQDEIKEATVKMTSSGASIVGDLTMKFTDIMGNGGRKEQLFSVKADSQTATTEVFKVEISKAEAQNTKEPAGVSYLRAADSTETVIIQNPATFQITNIILPDTIRASQIPQWNIKLIIRNTGQASAVIQTPSEKNIVIKVNGIDRKDYIISAPVALQSGGLILVGGRTDTLIYAVTTSPATAGPASIEVILNANDQNSQKFLLAPGRRDFYITSSAAVQLLRTEVLCKNYDGSKGLVNRGQLFAVRVTVQNLGRKKVKDVVVKLTNTGGSIIAQNQLTIPTIEYNEMRFADFEITADPNQTTLSEVFTSQIIAAIEDETGLPAVIDNTVNNKARIAVYDPAKLELSAWATDSVFTTNQMFSLKTLVKNIGNRPADVDDAGLVRLYVPKDYRIIVGSDSISGSYGVSFKPDQPIEWSIVTPGHQSGPDTLVAYMEFIPRDKNIDQQALVVQRYDTAIVRTLATDIFYSTRIIEPAGAVDRIVSTYQNFTVESKITYSENLKEVAATLILPKGQPSYNFKSAADSTQPVPRGARVSWELIAPDTPDNDFRWIRIRITAMEKNNPKLFRDSLQVKTVTRAKLELSANIAYPEGAKSGKLRISRPFGISAFVHNTGVAGVIGNGELEINLGASGCTFADVSETKQKVFYVDSVVTWNLLAPSVPTPSSPIIIKYISKPKDENNSYAEAFDNDVSSVKIPVSTELGGNIEISLQIIGPAGAKDNIISSDQVVTIGANIAPAGVDSLKARLISGSFSFDTDVKPIQVFRPGESVQWRIKAPADSMSNAEIKVVSWGNDSRDETVQIKSDTVSLFFDVIRRAEAEVIAAIVSPLEATDGKVSVDQQFLIRAYLENYGQANFTDDAYKLELSLPAGYTTLDPLTKSTTRHNAVEWYIKAPSTATGVANIEVRVPARQGPNDENSGQEAHFWQEKRRSFFAIETVQKTVFVSAITENRTPNTVVKGQQHISMLGIRIFNQKEDQISNSIILNGFRVTIKDREGNPIENPAQVISKIIVTDYHQPNTIYGEVAGFNSGSMIPITLTQPAIIYPGQADSIDLVIDIAAEPTLNSVMFSIDADTNIFVQEALTFNKPLLKNLLNETGVNLKLESDFCLIKGDNLKEYFTNYPNPFGNPQRPTTTITYYLTEDTDVDIKIYTLVGELVWSRSFKANEPQGRKGSHDGDVTWDARNDKGYKVLNGVYIIYIKTGTGETAMTKAAVIK